MTKTDYQKMIDYLDQKLNFYIAIQANSNRKTNFHGKKFHSVNAFEAAVRIQELNSLKSFVELQFKPMTAKEIVKAFFEFLKLKFQLHLKRYSFKK